MCPPIPASLRTLLCPVQYSNRLLPQTDGVKRDCHLLKRGDACSITRAREFGEFENDCFHSSVSIRERRSIDSDSDFFDTLLGI